jgi:predicted enzyme related to lactoylglutathione lyase
MLTLGSVVLGVDDLDRAKKFWMTALNLVPREPGDDTWVVLKQRTGSGVQIALMTSETPIQEHPRIHLDLYTEDQSGEVERLKSAGAVDVAWDRYPDEADFVVLADTEGNRFCVIDTTAGSDT